MPFISSYSEVSISGNLGPSVALSPSLGNGRSSVPNGDYTYCVLLYQQRSTGYFKAPSASSRSLLS